MVQPNPRKDIQSLLYLDKNSLRSPDSYPQRGRLTVVLLSLVLGSLLVAIDTTIISVAIPRISTEFEALEDVGWYGSAYLITLTAFQPPSGNVFKLFNPKIAYIASIIIFEVGSSICAATRVSAVFIVGRTIAGIGAAGLIQGALAIITYIAPLKQRPLYIGIVISVFGISACLGPILGGVLTDHVGWRWCFWINLPLGGAVLLFTFFSLPFKLRGDDNHIQKLPLRTKLLRMDPMGIILLLGTVYCLLLVLQQGGVIWPWKSAKIIGLLIGFTFLSVLFGLLQWRLGENAMIPFLIFQDRTVLTGSLFLALGNSSSYVKLYFLPFYFQAVRESSAIKSGVQFISLALPQTISAILTSALISKTGHIIPFLLLGQIVCATGTGLLMTLKLNTATLSWATFMVLAGWGAGMAENTPYIAIQAAIESPGIAILTVSGIATFFALLGSSIAISIGENLLVNGLLSEVPRYTLAVSPQAIIDAGPLNLPALTTSPRVLQSLRDAYAGVISNIMMFALVVVCVSVPVACGMKWLNLKSVAEKRTQETLGSS